MDKPEDPTLSKQLIAQMKERNRIDSVRFSWAHYAYELMLIFFPEHPMHHEFNEQSKTEVGLLNFGSGY